VPQASPDDQIETRRGRDPCAGRKIVSYATA